MFPEHLDPVPPAPRSDIVETLHGREIADPFRSLEDPTNPEVAAWVAAETSRSEHALAALPEHAAILSRLTALWRYPRKSLPVLRGRRRFEARADGVAAHSSLWVIEADGIERVALDPDAWAPDGTLSLGRMAFSPDGRFIAYVRHAAGSDWGTLHVYDVDRACDLPEVAERVRWDDIAWLADSSAFLYAASEPGDDTTERLLRHRLGTPIAADEVIYRPTLPAPAFVSPVRFENGQGAALYIYRGTDSCGAVSIIEPDGRTIRPLLPPGLANLHPVHREGDLVYALTDLDAPRNRLVAIDIADPAPAKWRTVIAESDDVMGAASPVAGRWLLTFSRHGWDEFVSFAFDGSDRRGIDMPGPGKGWFLPPDPADAGGYAYFGSLATPTDQYWIDPVAGTARLHRRNEARASLAGSTLRQIFVPARDGAQIPLTLIHPPDIPLTGTSPTLLYAYGGNAMNSTHYFTWGVHEWVTRGGLYAIASIRGGSEEGEDWHRAAMGAARRQISFNDFQDCAEWLIRQGYCSARTLGIKGVSNGGLLVAACAVQRPDLFGAVVCIKGVLDMLRFSRFTIGSGWSGEYGLPDNPEDFRNLLAYSPLHNVRPDIHYPPMLIVTADHDDRVPPLNSYKFAAALQSGISPVVLLQTYRDVGHCTENPTEHEIKLTADELAFLRAVLTQDAAACLTSPPAARPGTP